MTATVTRPAAGYPLNQPLPPDVAAGGGAFWNRYRRYPVFSWPWLRGRSLLALALVGGFSLVTAAGSLAVAPSASGAWAAAASMFVAFMLMSTVGPSLATLARHMRGPLRRERGLVVAGLLAGMILSYFADQWADAAIASSLGAETQAAAAASRAKLDAMGGLQRALLTTLNLIVLMVIYGVFGGGLSLRAYFSERRRWEASSHAREMAQLRERKERSDLRLGVLQAQVEPHFLFNTLGSVRALVRQDAAQAEATLDALVAHLRATIPKLRDDDERVVSTLGQQLEICTSYLELMRLRMGGRLEYEVEVEAGLRERPFPPLLLITLVENAIKHGIEPRPGAGRVILRADVEDNDLRVRVIDDGAGLQPGLGSGVGLANVRDQLATRHGPAASFRLRSGRHGGAEAEIRVPLEPAP